MANTPRLRSLPTWAASRMSSFFGEGDSANRSIKPLGRDQPLPGAGRGERLQRARLGAEQEGPLVVGHADRREVDDDRPPARAREPAPQRLLERRSPTSGGDLARRA